MAGKKSHLRLPKRGSIEKFGNKDFKEDGTEITFKKTSESTKSLFNHNFCLWLLDLDILSQVPLRNGHQLPQQNTFLVSGVSEWHGIELGHTKIIQASFAYTCTYIIKNKTINIYLDTTHIYIYLFICLYAHISIQKFNRT